MTIGGSTMDRGDRTTLVERWTIGRRCMAGFAAVSGVVALTLFGSGTARAAGAGDAVMHLHASTSTAVNGQHVTFSTTIAPAVTGGPAPTGTVTFGGAISPSVTVPLATNGATGKREAKTVGAFHPGSESVTATYNGDANYAPQGPSTVIVTVTKAGTTTTVTATQSTLSPGHWTITARVRAVQPGRGTATGSVVFTVNNITGNPVVLNTAANASLHVVLSKNTTHAVKVTYPGNANFTGSQGTLTFTS